jgi:hypothetical protein
MALHFKPRANITDYTANIITRDFASINIILKVIQVIFLGNFNLKVIIIILFEVLVMVIVKLCFNLTIIFASISIITIIVVITSTTNITFIIFAKAINIRDDVKKGKTY